MRSYDANWHCCIRGGTAGTFEANAPLTVTASVTETHEVEAEQYKLTITKGTGVASTTPAAGEHWLDKGTTQEVTATYSTGYQADSGTGSYTMDSAKTANVTAKKITYSVTYNYNCPSGATNNGGSTASQTKTYGESLTLMANGFSVPTKTGGTYVFNGWNTAANGSGTAYAAKATYTGNAALTLYAQWKWTYTTYTVAYNYNLPSGWTNNGGLPSSQTKTYGTDLKLSTTKPNVPTKATSGYNTTDTSTGYHYKTTYSAVFKEWNTQSNGKGTAYAAGGTYKGNAAVTLYAIWTTSTGKTSEQYYVTISPDSNVNTCTSSRWVSSGGSITVSATAKGGYKIKSGTGTYTITAKKTISVTSESAACGYLNLFDPPYYITKVRCYYNRTGYNEYTYSNLKKMPVYAGQKVVFFHDSGRIWAYKEPNRDVTNLGRGAACQFIVPSNASGWGELHFTARDGDDSDILNISNSGGWVLNCSTPILGE